VVICLERGADLHMAQLMPLLLTISCFSKIQIGFAFLVPAYVGSPGKGPLNGCVCSAAAQFAHLCIRCINFFKICHLMLHLCAIMLAVIDIVDNLF